MRKLIAILLTAILALTLSSSMLTAQEDQGVDAPAAGQETEVAEEEDAEEEGDVEETDGEVEMRKYMFYATYTPIGVQGMLAEGPASRVQDAHTLFESIGGSVEGFYWITGEPAGFLIANVPDDVSLMALSLLISASGAAEVEVTPLMTTDQLEAATQMTLEYRPPGQ